jgi:hypothetical protein
MLSSRLRDAPASRCAPLLADQLAADQRRWFHLKTSCSNEWIANRQFRASLAFYKEVGEEVGRMEQRNSCPRFWPDPAALTIPVSAGELLDKITILTIKRQRVRDDRKRSAAARELDVLEQAATHVRVADEAGEIAALASGLEKINGALWDVEDALRAMERDGDFGAAFVEAARSVYRLNDERARLKNAINQVVGSALVEVKEYTDYSNCG